MVPRPADPFKPAPEVSYSKGEVNRAGQLLRRFYAQPAERFEKDPLGEFDLDALVDAMVKVTWWRSLHARPLSKVAANLRYHVEQEDGFVGRRIDVSQRLKRRATIIDKLEREPSMALTQMWDIGGVRARLPSLRCLQAVGRRLKKTWTIAHTRDYVATPKESGYRAVHQIVRRDGRLIEVQLRTIRQDAWANQVEDDSRALGIGFKFGKGSTEIHRYYRTIADAFAAMDRGEPISEELADEIRASFAQVRGQLRRKGARGTR